MLPCMVSMQPTYMLAICFFSMMYTSYRTSKYSQYEEITKKASSTTTTIKLSNEAMKMLELSTKMKPRGKHKT